MIEHNTDGHKKSEIIRMSSLHKGSKVTCLVAKETRFFLGDTNGKVTALNGSVSSRTLRLLFNFVVLLVIYISVFKLSLDFFLGFPGRDVFLCLFIVL